MKQQQTLECHPDNPGGKFRGEEARKAEMSFEVVRFLDEQQRTSELSRSHLAT